MEQLDQLLMEVDENQKTVQSVGALSTASFDTQDSAIYETSPLQCGNINFIRDAYEGMGYRVILASSWDYGTYHIGDQQRLRWAWHPCSLARAFTVCTHEVWKKTKGPTKNKTSSSTGWLHMRVWRMSLWRTKSAIISWAGSFGFYS